MDKIKIYSLTIEACHGVHSFEKTTPQKFIIDAELSFDFYRSSVTDGISDTVSYSDVCALLEKTVKENTFNLIEKLAYECAFSILEKFEKIGSVKLTLHKPDAPMQRVFESVAVEVNVKREICYLSLGSSEGDRKGYLDKAVSLLGSTRGISVKNVSKYIATEPYGGVAKNEFLNCAVCISTFLSPYALLDEINRIESECKRVRKERWGDRTLDIDIIYYGNEVINSERLRIPHPERNNRDFVKIPLKEIAPWLFDVNI